MFRKLIRSILYKPVVWAANRFASKPVKEKVFGALDELYTIIQQQPGKKGLLLSLDPLQDNWIIFSDMHKGARDGADDFAGAEKNYLSALEYYNQQGFGLVALGDSEELWENSLRAVKKYNTVTFDAEKKFLQRDKFIKIFGNHDLFWDNDPLAAWHLKHIYGQPVSIYEGLIFLIKENLPPPGAKLQTLKLQTLKLFLTHGHQGDAQSDGNWLSKFFVANIWAPLQAYLRINPNTPAWDAEKKTLHNDIMYEWSSQKVDTWLITGHTHQPVFGSLTHLERLYRNFQEAQAADNDEVLQNIRQEIRKREKEFTAVSVDYMHLNPTYYNSGCCCYSDGDITGIEIAGGEIRLVKWSEENGREVLEARSLYGSPGNKKTGVRRT